MLYAQRAAGSSGIALGALALPAVLAGLAAKQPNELSGRAVALLLACTAASAAALGILLWQLQHGTGLKGQQQNGSKRQQGSSSSSLAAKPGAWAGRGLPLALAALAALATLAASTSGGLPSAATVLAAAAAAAGCQHALLVGLPSVFTAGEALVAAEAAVLLLCSALQQLWQAESQQQPGPYARFALLLIAGSLAAAALLFTLLLWRQRAAAHKRGSRHGGGSAHTAAAAVVALLTAAGAAPAALWAVRLALSSRRRLLVCGWWAGVLGAALPIMGWLSGSGRMRGILGECRLVCFSLSVSSCLAEMLSVAECSCRACHCPVLRRAAASLPGPAPHSCLRLPALLPAPLTLPSSAQGLPPAGSGPFPPSSTCGAPAAGRRPGCRICAAAGGGGGAAVRPAWHR